MGHTKPHVFSQYAKQGVTWQFSQRTASVVQLRNGGSVPAENDDKNQSGKMMYSSAVTGGHNLLRSFQFGQQQRQLHHGRVGDHLDWRKNAPLSPSTYRGNAFRQLVPPVKAWVRYNNAATSNATVEGHTPATAASPLLDSDAKQQPRDRQSSRTLNRTLLARNKQIRYLKLNHSLDDVLAAFCLLKEEGIPPNQYTYSLVFDALSDSGPAKCPRPRALLSLWDEYRQLKDWDKCDNQFIHECILRGLDRAQREARKQLMDEYCRKREALTEKSWSEEQLTELDEAIRKLENGVEHWSALAIEHFRSINNLTPNSYLYAVSCASGKADIQALQMVVERATKVFGCLLPAMVPHVIECYRRTGKHENALHMFEALQNRPDVPHDLVLSSCSSVIHAYREANKLEEAMALIMKYSKFLQTEPTVEVAIAAVKQGNARIACNALRTLKQSGYSIGSGALGRLLGEVVGYARDDVASPVIEALLTFDQTMSVVREYVDAFVIANLKKGKAYVALKVVSLLARNDILLPVQTLDMCFQKIADDPSTKKLLFKTLFTISRMMETIVLNQPEACSVKELCLAVSESLVEQFGGNLEFILMRARLDPELAREPAIRFFAQNTINGEEQHQLALELACRLRDDELVIRVADGMRKHDFFPPATSHHCRKAVIRALETDALLHSWWLCNASRLPTTNIMNPSRYVPIISNPNEPMTVERTERHVSGYGAMLALASRSGSVEDVIKIIKPTLKAGLLNFPLTKLAFKACALKKDFNAVQRLAEILHTAEKEAATTEERDRLRALARTGLVVACIHGGELKMAREVLTYMTQKENLVPSSINVYGEYLVKLDTGDLAEVRSIHEEVRNLGLNPSYYFYNVLLKMYAKASNPSMFMQIMGEMRELNFKPKSITYGTALGWAIRIDNEAMVAFIFHEAQLHGFRDNSAMQNMLLKYYLKKFKNRAIVEKIWSMYTGYNKPTHSSYAAMLFARTCLPPIDMEGAIEMFKQIPEPDGNHYAAIICGYAYRLRNFAAAEAWLDQMNLKRTTSDAGTPVKMFWRAYDALISSYCAHGNIEAALRVYQMMLGHCSNALIKIQANGSVLRGCAYRIAVAGEGEDKDRYVRLAEDLFKDIRIKAPESERSGTPDLVHSNPVRDAAETPASSTDRSEVDLFKDIRIKAPESERSGTPDLVHSNPVRDAAETPASSTDCSEVEVRDDTDDDVIPLCYLKMISVYLLAGRPAEADALYKEMSERRCIPVRFVRDAEGLLLNQRDETFLRSSTIQHHMQFSVFRPAE